jgi:hypothetical protein
MAEEGLSLQWYLDLGEQAEIPPEAIVGFLESPAYASNPRAWDWMNCLQSFGWRCSGMTGEGTLNPTPATSCSSDPASGLASLTVENPFL